jgi:hypothetical protein
MLLLAKRRVPFLGNASRKTLDFCIQRAIPTLFIRLCTFCSFFNLTTARWSWQLRHVCVVKFSSSSQLCNLLSKLFPPCAGKEKTDSFYTMFVALPLLFNCFDTSLGRKLQDS